MELHNGNNASGVDLLNLVFMNLFLLGKVKSGSDFSVKWLGMNSHYYSLIKSGGGRTASSTAFGNLIRMVYYEIDNEADCIIRSKLAIMASFITNELERLEHLA